MDWKLQACIEKIAQELEEELADRMVRMGNEACDRPSEYTREYLIRLMKQFGTSLRHKVDKLREVKTVI